MKNISLAAIFTAAVLLFCACASMPKSLFKENLIIPADYAGVVHAGDSGTEKELSYLNYIGASWILYTFNWSSIEPEQGRWDYSYYDSIVDNNAAVGIKTLGVLAYDVGWIHEDGKGRKYIPPHRLPDFLQYIRNTVEHFKGRIGAWCIWNEPNFHFWTGTDDEFVELSRQAADVVREVDSEVILLGGAFNRNVLGLPERFIRKLFESGAMDKTDGIAFHPYELNPTRSAILYDKFKKIVDDYGFGDKIWITEAGYPTGGWYPTKVTEKKFPEYVMKTIVLLAARGSKMLLWYQMFDPVNRTNSNSEDFFGLLRSREDYTSKGAHAFRLCANYMQGATCYVQEPGRDGIPASLRMFRFISAEGGALVMWNEGLGSRRISLQIPGIDRTKHDIVTGETVPVQEGTFNVGSMPVFITWRNGENQ